MVNDGKAMGDDDLAAVNADQELVGNGQATVEIDLAAVGNG